MQLEEIVAERNLEMRRKIKDSKKAEKTKDYLTDPGVYCLAVFFVLVALALLGGCNHQRANVPVNNLGQKAEFHADLFPMPEPKKYVVRLNWKHNSKIPPRGWFIRRLDMDTGEERTVYREERASYFRDEYIDAGSSYYYTLGSIEENGSIVRAETVVRVPYYFDNMGNVPFVSKGNL